MNPLYKRIAKDLLDILVEATHDEILTVVGAVYDMMPKDHPFRSSIRTMEDYIEEHETVGYSRMVIANSLTKLIDFEEEPVETSPVLKVRKLHPDAKIPHFATPGSAGLDITATEIVNGNGFIEYRTGLAFEIPPGFVGLAFPRSSISKYDLMLSNSVGVIDSDYRGEVTARFKVTAEENVTRIYEVGDRIFQLVIVEVPKMEIQEVQELGATARGTGGYGSTGK